MTKEAYGDFPVNNQPGHGRPIQTNEADSYIKRLSLPLSTLFLFFLKTPHSEAMAPGLRPDTIAAVCIVTAAANFI